MLEILDDVEGIVCMMDDVLIHGNTKAAHDERLARVLNRLQKAGYTLNN